MRYMSQNLNLIDRFLIYHILNSTAECRLKHRFMLEESEKTPVLIMIAVKMSGKKICLILNQLAFPTGVEPVFKP